MKTKEEILEQPYMTAKDLKKIMPSVGINKCTEYIKMCRDEMEQKGYFIPSGRPLIALTKVVKKKFGL